MINNNLSPLPFYDSLEQQHHRKDYAYGQIYPLITHRNMLLPFQIILSSGTKIKNVRLFNFNTGEFVEIRESMLEAGLTITAYTGYSILKYPGTLPIVEIKHEGRYVLEIDIVGFSKKLYSEVFTVTNDVSRYLLIEYSSPQNFKLKNGMVDFSDNFKFKCYLDAQIGKPEYNFEEEATERMGYTFVESQVSKKVYKFTFLAPEYLCDALRIVRLCENKQIISKDQVYDLSTFSMEPKWEEQGDLAAVECEFETDTVIVNIGGYEPKLLGGDFNNDFNNDFDNKL